MASIERQVEKGIQDISIAALRSWLEAQDLTHSANTREAMVKRLTKLIKKGELSLEELDEGIINIEEASGKRIFLYEVEPDDIEKLRDSRQLRRHLRPLRASLSERLTKAPRLPIEPVLVYVQRTPEQIRAKWAETQTMVEIDRVRQRFKNTKTTKVVVLVADTETGVVQLRFDKPESLHSHLDEKGNPGKREYFSHYQEQARKILGVNLNPIELRAALKSLVETQPRVVKLPFEDHRSGANSKVRFASKVDIRDDDDWKAMHSEGGDEWAYDGESVYWLPSASNGKLNREVFTDLDARTGMLRVEADCHEGEIEYAISQIRTHQTRAS